MLEVGDKVIWEGKVGIIESISRPKCKCKGMGTYNINVDGVINKVSLRTKLEKYETIGLISTNISPHNL